MKKFFVIPFILLLLFFAACSNQSIEESYDFQDSSDNNTSKVIDYTESLSENNSDDSIISENGNSKYWNGEIDSSYSGGDGSQSNPYIISTPEQFAYMIAASKDDQQLTYAGVYFKLNNDIYLNDTSKEEWYLKSDKPLLCFSNGFKGIFDGSGYSIYGYCYNNSSKLAVGLFGTIQTEGYVKNLNLVDVYMNCDEHIGAICHENFGTITNCSVSGSITGNVILAGLVGVNEGVIEKCVNSADIFSLSGNGCFGGIAGANHKTISCCINNGSINGTVDAGGIAGGNSGTISECYNTGEFNCPGYDIGGIVGKASYQGIIQNCYNTVNIDAKGYVGGIVGIMQDSSKVDCCYTLGTVSGKKEVGDITGYVKNKYNVTNSYYINNEKKNKYSPGTPITETEALSSESYVGFDFDSIWTIDPTSNDYLYPTLANCKKMI